MYIHVYRLPSWGRWWAAVSRCRRSPSPPATRYGEALAAYYTVAWMDRWVPVDPTRRRAAHTALVEGPRPADETAPSSAAYLSVRRYSAFALSAPPGRGGPLTEMIDLRLHAGRSPVGDWAGANADTVGAETPGS